MNHNLSDREIEVAILIANGLRHKGIAQKLSISIKTVNHHSQHVREKLKVILQQPNVNIAEITHYTINKGLVELRFAEESRSIPDDCFTNREREVLSCVAQGLSDKEIGRVLSIATKTATRHRESGRNKLKKILSTPHVGTAEVTHFVLAYRVQKIFVV